MATSGVAGDLEFTFTLDSPPPSYETIEYRFPGNEYYLIVNYGVNQDGGYPIKRIDVSTEVEGYTESTAKRDGVFLARSTGVLRLKTDCSSGPYSVDFNQRVGEPITLVDFNQQVGKPITLRVFGIYSFKPLFFRCRSYSIQSPDKHVTYSDLVFDEYGVITKKTCSEESSAAAGGAGGASSGAAAGGAGASSAPSPPVPAPNPAYKAVKEALRTTTMPDGTRFLLGKEFTNEIRPYLLVTVKNSAGIEKISYIYLDDLSIDEPFGFRGRNIELLEPLKSVVKLAVSEFRPAAKDASRRSARKQRTSRRANRRKGTRQRSSKK